MENIFFISNMKIHEDWLPPQFFCFLGFFVKHLNSLREKSQDCGTNCSSLLAKNAKIHIVHLKKIFVAKYWYFFTFSKRNHLFLFRSDHKLIFYFQKKISSSFLLLNL